MSNLVSDTALDPFPQTVLAGSLVARFETIANRYPDRIALQCEDEGYSYRAIDQQASIIAGAIACKQPARHRPIVIATDDAFLTIAAMWGVLKSGHAYVTVDPSASQSTAAIIADSGAELIVVASRDVLPRLAVANPLVSSALELVVIDEQEKSLRDEQTDVSILPTDMAVILYTSGSTGQPKGIVCNHELLLHRVWHDTRQFQITPDARLMLTTAPNLGVSSGIIYGAMLNGASCHLYAMKERGVIGLPQWLRDNGITHYHTTPTIFRQLIDAFDGLIDLPHLRWIKLGGEATQRADVELFQRHVLPPCRLRAGYSITEALLVSEFYLTQETTLDGEKVPIGYPVEGKEILLLDESRQPVADGEVGEIAVRSRYLAQGYWQQPEQTAARFLPDPEQNDVRILLTGDLGRLRTDGMLEHWGRKDQMVKIRGYRVELSAVEGALLNLPTVHTAVVTTHDGQSENKQLVAYVVPADVPPTISEIRTALQQTLADYMIPSHFVLLDELPLLPNGKVDRKGLPAPDTRRPNLETAYVAARNPQEAQLVNLWEDLLEVHPIGIHDNFFALGGHSMLAARITAALHSTFGVDLSLALLLAKPTIAEVADYLRKQGPEVVPRIAPASKGELLVPIRDQGTRPPFFLVPGGSGGESEFLLYAPLLYQLGDDQPIYGLQARGLDGVTPPHRNLKSMAAAYIQAIRTVQPAGPYFLGGECTGGKVAFEMACQLQAQGEQVELLVLLDTVLEVTPPPQTYSQYRLHWARRRFAHHWQQLRQLTLRDQVRHLQKEVGVVRRLFAPKAQESAQARHRHQVQQNYRYLMANYRPTQSFVGNLALISSQQVLAGPSAAAWQSVTTGRVEVYAVPGVHQTYLGQYVNDTADCLRTCLGNAQTGASIAEDTPFSLSAV